MARIRFTGLRLDASAFTARWTGPVTIPAVLAQGDTPIRLQSLVINQPAFNDWAELTTQGGDLSDAVETAGMLKLTASDGQTVLSVLLPRSDRTAPYRWGTSDSTTMGGGVDVARHVPEGWTRTRLTPTRQNGVYESRRTVTLDAAGAFVSATAWGAPTRVFDRVRSATRTVGPDQVYRLAATRPLTPTSGTTSPNDVPEGWTREEPLPTPMESVWITTRNLNFSGRNFVDATEWGRPTLYQVVGNVSDRVYIAARNAPSQPDQPVVTNTLDEIQAWGLAVLALSDRTFSLELSDGQPDLELDAPTIPVLQTDVTEAFSYQLPEGTGGLLPHTYALTGIPEGFAFDAATRTLSGMGAAPDRFALTYRVTDGSGAFIDRAITLVVRPDPRPIWRIEVDWDGDGAYANDHSDVTERVVRVDACKRGRDFSGGFYGRSIAGLFQALLWDDDHLFDRFNAASDLHGKVVPGRSVRVSMLAAGDYVEEWGGVLDDVSPRETAGRRTVALRALGPISLLPRRTIDAEMQQSASVADAMGQVMELAGVPGNRIAALAGATEMDWWFLVRESVLVAVQDLEEVERGFFKEERGGRMALEASSARRTPGAPHQTFASPEVTPTGSEQALLGLRWSDPIKDIATRVVVPVRELTEGDSAETVWRLAEARLLEAGASITIQARVQSYGGATGLIVGVTDWQDITDFSANDAEDGSGTDRTAALVISSRNAGLAATITVENTHTGAVYLRTLNLMGTVVRITSEFEEDVPDAMAQAAYGDREYRVRTLHIAPSAARGHAQQLLSAFATPQARAALTYLRHPAQRLPDLSDVVAMRFRDDSRIYWVESVNHQWQRGGQHLVDLVISEVDATPSAAAPAVAITDPSGPVGQGVTLQATVRGGIYDGTPTYAWTVSAGTLDDASAAAPTWTRPTAEERVTITLTVSVAGTGTNAQDGTTATAAVAEVVADVTDLPVAAAPSITIDPVADGREGTTVELSATVTGGIYDGAPTYAWTVDRGRLRGATTATPTWTRPQVDADGDVEIGVTVTVAGTGTVARADTTDSAMAELSAHVLDLPAVAAPTVAINAIPPGIEGTVVEVGATVTGGRYDTIEYEWFFDAGGTYNPADESPAWQRPYTSGETISRVVRLTVTVRGDGTDTQDGSSATVGPIQTIAQVVGEGRTVPDPVETVPASAPSVTIDNVPNGREGTAVELSATLRGGVYDDSPSYAWSVPAGKGTLANADRARPTWTRPQVDEDEEIEISLTVTVSGRGLRADTGSSARDTATRTATVTETPDIPTPVLPDADAPSVAINAIPSGREGTSIRLSAALTGGTYDGLTYAWTAERGVLAGATTATPTWTRPQVGRDSEFTLRLTVTATGAGRTARAGSSDTASASRAASVTDTDEPISDTPWQEVAGSRSTDWGAWRATSTYSGSCSTRTRLYERSGTETWTEARTVSGVTERRSRSRSVTDTEYRAAPETGAWSAWSEVAGSRTVVTTGFYSTSTTRGECANRERQYRNDNQTTWTEARTNPCASPSRETRERSTTSSNTQWRSDPDAGEWSEWVEVSRRNVGDGTEVYEQRTNPCQGTQSRWRII